MLSPWKKSYDQPRQHIKKKRHYFANKGPSSQSCGFSSSHVWMWELDYKENWVLKNWCFWTVVLEKTLESPLDRKAMQPVSPTGNQYEYALERLCWSWNPNTLATWLEELTHLKRPWCLERLKARGVGDDRGWDGWMTLLTQWTWVWVNSGSRWWTGRPGMLQSMGSERIGHNWATELNYSKEVSGIQWEWYWSWNSNTWAPDVKSWLIWKDHDAGNDWGQEEKGTTEDQVVGWHHQLNGHEFG